MNLSGPKMVVTSVSTFWNSKDAIENQVALGEFAQLKEQHKDQVEIGSITFREGLQGSLIRQGKELLKSLPTVTLGSGLVAGALAAAGLATLPAALGFAGVAAAAFSLSVLGAGLKDQLQDDVPKGIGVHHTRPEPIEFTNLQDSSSASAGLQQMTLANMNLYPSSLHVLHLNGHGHGNKRVAGINGDEAHAKLQQSVLEAGRKYDVVFLETCQGSNLENLHRMADSADFAVAFEDLIPKSNTKLGRLPLHQVLGQALEASDGKEAAVLLAQSAGKHFDRAEPATIASVPLKDRLKKDHRTAMWTNTDSTTAAVDLKTVQKKLVPALGAVGQELQSLLESNPSLISDLRQARTQNLIESKGDLVDLGGFLAAAKGRLPEASVGHQVLSKALGALESSLLHKRTGAQIPLSGLSFHSDPKHSSNAGLPKAWTDFVERLS